jgi:MFS family permease
MPALPGCVRSQNWRTFFCHNVGFALLSFSSYGAAAWVPTFFVRNHGWSEAKAGQVFGWIVAIAATLGIVAGGRLADWMVERGRREATMRVGLIAALAWLPCGMLYPLAPDGNWAAALLVPSVFLAAAPFGVSAAAIQQMVPSGMRGQARRFTCLWSTSLVLAWDRRPWLLRPISSLRTITRSDTHCFGRILRASGSGDFALGRDQAVSRQPGPVEAVECS